jgi:cell division protein FtsQ
MKKLISYFTILVVVVILVFVVIQMLKGYDQTISQGLQVDITNPAATMFVHSDELTEMVIENYTDVSGMEIGEVDIDSIKRIVEAHPFVKSCRVYSSVDGLIKVEVEQRVPIVRVFTNSGEGFMLDQHGDIMPIPHHIPLSVLCASGGIEFKPEKFYGTNFRSLITMSPKEFLPLSYYFAIATEINKDPYFSILISQLHYNDEKEVELVPVIGDFVILFGNPDKSEDKLEKMKILYTHMIPYVDLSIYSTVNVTVKNRLIFKKKHN